MTLALGLMSGTSMDGVDAVACDIKMKGGLPSIKIVTRAKTAYPANLKKRLLAVSGPDRSAEDVCELNVEVARVFSRAALKAMRHPSLSGRRVEVIGSHGQTIRHMPQKGATLQIGDGAVIARGAGVKTWFNFRMADMAGGGEGAPLAPIVHLPLFGDRRLDVTVVNIGGIANITHIPAGVRDLARVIAFDTGPGNALMDIAAREAGAGECDKGGRMAASGKIDGRLLKRFLSHPYFKKRPPKSTGKEVFGESFMKRGVMGRGRLTAENLMATLAELTAATVMNEVNRLHRTPGRLVVCGGGAKNRYLVKRLQNLADDGLSVVVSDSLGTPCGAVEGALMALLAFYAERGIGLDLKTITGSRGGETILGELAPAPEK